MNAQELLHFILTHSEMLIGITIGLALVTVIFILVLPSSELKQNSVDLNGIEEALRRAIEKIPQSDGSQNYAQPRRESQVSSIQDEEEVFDSPMTHGNSPLAISDSKSNTKGDSKSDSKSDSKYESNHAAPVGAPTVGAIDPVVIERLKFEVSEREKKIKSLENEIAFAKAQAPKASSDSGAAHDDALAKIQELQGKLSEYAIIEEELADISKFKDENTRMKLELEVLRGGSSEGDTVIIDGVDMSAQVLMTDAADASSDDAERGDLEQVNAPKEHLIVEDDDILTDISEETHSEDQVVLEFQAAVENQAMPRATLAKDVSNAIPTGKFITEPIVESKAELAATAVGSVESPLDGSLDTSKMLQEIEKLGDTDTGEEGDPMAGLLDTEKLLAEVRELGGVKDASANSEQSAVDDLMSEFEAEQQHIKAKA